MLHPRFLLPLLFLFVAGCASPKGSGSFGKTTRIRTTAFTHTERDHIRYGKMSASGTRLTEGSVRSAAADWSKFPVGTKFRLKQTGQVYVVDDYGSALVGTSTIDLYTPTKREMNQWGVRFVDVEIIHWGSPQISLKLLTGRTRAAHVRTMARALKKQI